MTKDEIFEIIKEVIADETCKNRIHFIGEHPPYEYKNLLETLDEDKRKELERTEGMLRKIFNKVFCLKAYEDSEDCDNIKMLEDYGVSVNTQAIRHIAEKMDSEILRDSIEVSILREVYDFKYIYTVYKNKEKELGL